VYGLLGRVAHSAERLCDSVVVGLKGVSNCRGRKLLEGVLDTQKTAPRHAPETKYLTLVSK